MDEKSADSGLVVFDSLNNYSDIERLISDGEVEGIIECKSPQQPRLNPGVRTELSKALSGFSNTDGGVILWGVSTTKHKHSGLDVLTQIEPMGNCRRFAQEIDRTIPTLTTPPIVNSKYKVLTKNISDTRGVIVTYIPKTVSDPIQSKLDYKFYFRSGDDFIELPYELLKRLFAATQSPDLVPAFDYRIVKLEQGGIWKIPIIIQNNSSAVGEHVVISVVIENPQACQNITTENFRDVSEINPGTKTFMTGFTKPIHRGLNMVVGNINISMSKVKRAKRVLRISITIYANKMRARRWTFSVQLAKKGFSVKPLGNKYIY